MTVSAKCNKNKGLTLFSTLIIGFIALIGLQGCSSSSSGGGTTVIATQDASGLFKDGTAELNSGATMLSDLRAFVHNGRIIVFSISGHLLFDGQITDITGDDFTATVTLYETGQMTQPNIAVTGKITSQSQITGTLSGTGVGSGTFTLTFDTAYNTAATIERMRDKPDEWEGDFLSTFSSVGDVIKDSFEIFNTNEISMGVINSDLTDGCLLDGTITIPDSTINIYEATQNIPAAINPSLCLSLQIDPAVKYTGFVTILSESNVDNDFLYAVTNGTNSIFGLLKQP